MATSGTTAFDMDFTEIAEEAWERAGREMRSGYDLRTEKAVKETFKEFEKHVGMKISPN